MEGLPARKWSMVLLRADSGTARHTYWLEGAMAGAIVLGSIIYMSSPNCLSGSRCQDHPRVVIEGSVIGFALGALVGSRIHKSGS